MRKIFLVLLVLALPQISSAQSWILDLESAKENGTRGLQIAQEIGIPRAISLNAELLSKVYEKQGKGMKALEMYKLFVQMKDSLNNEATQKATIRHNKFAACNRINFINTPITDVFNTFRTEVKIG